MEDIKEIANSIKSHYKLERENIVSNYAIGRSSALLEGNDKVFWLTNREDQGGYRTVTNVHGEVIGTEPDTTDTLSGIDGSAVYKNTKLGELLIKYSEGCHTYIAPRGKMELEIYSRASYSLDHSHKEVINLRANISGDKTNYQYKNISEILKRIKDLEEEIEAERKKAEAIQTEKEKSKQLDIIKAKEKELEDTKSKMQSFIRKNAELRNQHILDPKQEDIKRSNIFDGTLVIDGGPGTGKTTALIQRIKFLKAQSILEYVDLNDEKKKIIFDDDNWIFFSPSELLRLYLKNNMTEEGLGASDEKVKVWRTYKTELCRRYKLFNSETRRPFLDLNKDGEYFDLDFTKIESLSDEFDKYFFGLQKEFLDKIVNLETDQFKWKFLALGIKEFITKNKKPSEWKGLIRFYLQIKKNFGERVNDNINRYNDLSDRIANEILFEIKKDPQLLGNLYKLIEINSSSVVVDDENEEETVDFEEDLATEQKEKEVILFKNLKSICRKKATVKIDKGIKITKMEQELLDQVSVFLDKKDLHELGELSYFIKHFRRIISGPVVNIISKLPNIYKSFRKYEINEYLTDKGKQRLTEILKDDNKRLHHEEQSFILYKINTIIQAFYNTDKDTYESSNHSFIAAFRDYSRAIIAIDEATDFSILDILSMHSLTNPFVSSVTLSGDLMQRMTSYGISNWSGLSKFYKGINIQSLLISYRQSNTLLEVARRLYINETGNEPIYQAYADKNEVEPKPLAFFSDDEDKKINWIAERIIEINNAYGHSIPSIAIFLAQESQDLEIFTRKMNSLDILSDIGIKVILCRDGQILGDKNTVRVFSIDHIKGLEFEAVFFHNINELEANPLLLRYFYVGLSRATFYLAITGTNGIPDSISAISPVFDRNGHW